MLIPNQKIDRQLELLYKSKQYDCGVEVVSKSWQDYMKYVISSVTIDGYWMEFGCYAGGSISFIADNMPPNINKIYGFDSFKGIPEQWKGLPKGFFNLNGKPPIVKNKKIEFVCGYFNDTLPIFIKTMDKPASFIHIDCDLYSSCNIIFSCLKEKIVSGTIIAFDEIHGHEDCLSGEMMALIETDLRYEWIAHTKYIQAAIRIL